MPEMIRGSDMVDGVYTDARIKGRADHVVESQPYGFYSAVRAHPSEGGRPSADAWRSSTTGAQWGGKRSIGGYPLHETAAKRSRLEPRGEYSANGDAHQSRAREVAWGRARDAPEWQPYSRAVGVPTAIKVETSEEPQSWNMQVPRYQHLPHHADSDGDWPYTTRHDVPPQQKALVDQQRHGSNSSPEETLYPLWPRQQKMLPRASSSDPGQPYRDWQGAYRRTTDNELARKQFSFLEREELARSSPLQPTPEGVAVSGAAKDKDKLRETLPVEGQEDGGHTVSDHPGTGR